jgi:hypothetical protein
MFCIARLDYFGFQGAHMTARSLGNMARGGEPSTKRTP